MNGERGIKLVLSDVDGTLLTSDKTVTQRSEAAVRELRNNGIAFAIASSRPPRGLVFIIEQLEIDTPTGAFSGAMIVRPDLEIADRSLLSPSVAASVLEVLDAYKVERWVYCGMDWFVQDPETPHALRETGVIRFSPRRVADFESQMNKVAKIVGVMDDPVVMTRLEADLKREFAGRVSVSSSQPYYVDLTHPSANKGTVVDWLSMHMNIPPERIATIGDTTSDVPMFKRSGFRIAMGNAVPEVQAEADAVTSSNDDEGFARAIEDHILPLARLEAA